ncbi:MAG: short chain enoyl-CoA hydratase [Rhodoglobus sp.]|nr:short chain enoyl-CoA hydratase [Rhodoglobus sp.]
MSSVETSVDADVLVITLNRPEVRNAVNAELAAGLAAALDRLESDAGLRVAVLTGAGPSFCSGMDLAANLRGESPRVPGRGFAGLVEGPPKKPLIAAVEGHAVAGGFEIALACDLVVAGRTAQFGLPEVKRGLVAAGGGLLRLPDRIPYSAAMRLILTGEPFGAERAYELGLVTEVVEPGRALEAALALAHLIAANAPLSIAASKEVIARYRDWPTAELFARQAEIIAAVSASEDAREGATAFLERRPPRWSGR